MTTSAASLALRRLAQVSRSRLSTASKRPQPLVSRSSRFSTNLEAQQEQANPSDFVQGVTAADLENDPALKEFFAKNFPARFGTGEDDGDLYDLSLLDPEYDTEEATTTTTTTTTTATLSSPVTDDNVDGDGSKNNIEFLMKQQCDLSMNIRPFITYRRAEEGSRDCRVLRETTNMMPGILYGGDPTKGILSMDPSSKILVKTPWKFIQRELDRFTYHNFESRVYDLTLFEDEDDDEGTVHRVMPRDVQFHPIHNKIYCCNYLRYYPGKPINIPIVYINEEESPAIKRGGFLAPFNRHVSCIVEDGVKIPEAIEMDFTGAKLKEVMRRDRLIFPDGVTPSKKTKEDFLLGTVFGRRVDVEEAADPEA